MFFIFYLNAIMLAAVVEELTADIKPGMNPDADTNVNTEPSMVLTVTLPTSPTYNPPKVSVAFRNALPLKYGAVSVVPPENCPFST
jgi:hypothetical protein